MTESTALVSPTLEKVWLWQERPQANAQWSAVILVGGFQPEQIRTISRLRELVSLPHGWDSYGSPPPTSVAVDRAINIVLETTQQVFFLPRIVPVPGGGVQLEWTSGQRELEIEIDNEGCVEYLKAERGIPLEEGPIEPTKAIGARHLIAWLTS